jgi:hypothetical protein
MIWIILIASARRDASIKNEESRRSGGQIGLESANGAAFTSAEIVANSVE